MRILQLSVTLLFLAVGLANAGSLPSACTQTGVDQVTCTFSETSFQTTELNGSSTGSVISLPQFNAAGWGLAGDTLTNAVLDVDGYIEGTIQLTNNAGTPVTIYASSANVITQSTMYVTSDSGGDDILNGSGTNLTFGPGTSFMSCSVITHANCDAISFAVGQTETFPGEGVYTANGAIYNPTLTGGQLTPYEGSGNADLYVFTDTQLVLNGGGGNLGEQQTTEAAISGSIVYNYAPPSGPTPEPVSMALLGSGLACLGLLKRKRFTR